LLERYQCSSLAEIQELIAEKQAAGILPSTARTAFNSSDVIAVALDRYNKGFADDIVLAWNPRTVEMSAGLEKLKDILTRVLQISPITAMHPVRNRRVLLAVLTGDNYHGQ